MSLAAISHAVGQRVGVHLPPDFAHHIQRRLVRPQPTRTSVGRVQRDDPVARLGAGRDAGGPIRKCRSLRYGHPGVLHPQFLEGRHGGRKAGGERPAQGPHCCGASGQPGCSAPTPAESRRSGRCPGGRAAGAYSSPPILAESRRSGRCPGGRAAGAYSSPPILAESRRSGRCPGGRAAGAYSSPPILSESRRSGYFGGDTDA